jgi:hypothetical protein
MVVVNMFQAHVAKMKRTLRSYRLRTINRSYVSVALLLVGLLGSGALLWSGMAKAAGTATLALSPSAQTVGVGGTIQFNIVATVTNDSTNGIQANLNYDSTMFDSGTANCGSALALKAQGTVSGGVIRLACLQDVGNSAPPATGTFTVGTITLHAASGGVDTETFRVNSDLESSVASTSQGNPNILSGTTGGTYTVDATPPNTNITAAPSSPTNATTADFSFTSTEGSSTFQCQIDGGSFSTCTSPKQYTGLSLGSHTFNVKATDAYGNVDASPATHTWTISSLVGPTVSITAPTNGTSVRGTVVLAANAADSDGTVSSVQFKVDGTNQGAADTSAPYTVNWDTTAVSEASHTITAVATDNDSNATTSSSVTVTVDNTAPNTTITSTPINTTQSGSASFTFSSNESPVTFACQIDGGGFSTCTSPKNYTGLAFGSHTFQVRATDPAGNVDSTPASETWSITDTTAPSVPGTPSASTPATDNTPTWTWTASTDNIGIDHYQVQWCATSDFSGCGSNVANASSATYTHSVALAENDWFFRVRALDGAGNASAFSAAGTVYIDTTPPQTTILSSAIGTTQSRTATFTFITSEAPATYQCQLDGGSYTTCNTPQTYNNLTVGSHTFNVRAIDQYGNTDASPATETWTVFDSTAPTVPGTPTTTTPTSNPRPDWTWTASTDTFGVDHYEVQWCTASNFSGCNSNTASSFTTSYTHTADLAVNTWYFRVRAVDASGNPSAYSSNGTVVVTPPPIVISNLTITPATTGATVTWTTNFASTTQLEYGLGIAGSGYGSTTTLADTGSGVTSHTANMPTLVSCATYHLRALSTDTTPRSAQGTDTQFATAGCPGSATVTGAQSAAITFGAGGSLSFDDGDGSVGLTVPANASTANLNYQIERLTAAALTPAAAPSGLKAVADRAYQFVALQAPGTAVTTFAQPITVTMGYTEAMAAKYKQGTLKLYSRDTGNWAGLDNCTINTTARTVSCTTTHFSSFALFGEEVPPLEQLAGTLPKVGGGLLGAALMAGGAMATAVRLQRRRRRD